MQCADGASGGGAIALLLASPGTLPKRRRPNGRALGKVVPNPKPGLHGSRLANSRKLCLPRERTGTAPHVCQTRSGGIVAFTAFSSCRRHSPSAKSSDGTSRLSRASPQCVCQCLSHRTRVGG